VCRDTGRHFVGIELHPEYVEIARRRLDHRQPRLFD
jgi:DNA modification methylase